MEELTNEELVECLKDYSDLQALAAMKPNVPIYKLFCTLMKEQSKSDTIDYYNKIHNVYLSYIYLRSFSMMEDFALNSDTLLADEDLPDFKKYIKFNGSDNFSNKNMLIYIRNAFNHDDDASFDKFKFLDDAQYFEVNLRSLGLHSTFDINTLSLMFNSIADNMKNKAITSIEEKEDFDILSDDLYEQLDKIDINFYYHNGMLDTRTLKVLKSDDRENALKTYQNIVDPQKYNLTDVQKKELVSLINTYLLSDTNFNKLIKDNSCADDMEYIVKKVLPVPAATISDVLDQSRLATLCKIAPELSLADIINRSLAVKNGQTSDKFFEELDDNSFKNFIKNIFNYNWIKNYPKIICFDGIVNHLIKDDTIEVNGIQYQKDNIRNSLVHGRWTLDMDNNVNFYDDAVRNKNMYDYFYVSSFDVNDIDDFIHNSLKKANKKVK